MTFFVLFAAVVVAAVIVGLVLMVKSDKPRRPPSGASYWSGTNLPSGPFSTAS